jgi:hypothetical protein
MEIYEGVEVLAPQLLSSALDGGECSVSRPGRFILGKQPPLVIRHGHCGVEKYLLPLPVRNPSLYLLRHPGSIFWCK